MALQAFSLQQTTENNSDAVMVDVEEEEAKELETARLDVRILNRISGAIKISVSLSLLEYSKKLMLYTCG